MPNTIPCPQNGRCGSRTHLPGSQALQQCRAAANATGTRSAPSTPVSAVPPTQTSKPKPPPQEERKNINELVEQIGRIDEAEQRANTARELLGPIPLTGWIVARYERKAEHLHAGLPPREVRDRLGDYIANEYSHELEICDYNHFSPNMAVKFPVEVGNVTASLKGGNFNYRVSDVFSSPYVQRCFGNSGDGSDQQKMQSISRAFDHGVIDRIAENVNKASMTQPQDFARKMTSIPGLGNRYVVEHKPTGLRLCVEQLSNGIAMFNSKKTSIPEICGHAEETRNEQTFGGTGLGIGKHLYDNALDLCDKISGSPSGTTRNRTSQALTPAGHAARARLHEHDPYHYEGDRRTGHSCSWCDANLPKDWMNSSLSDFKGHP